MDDDTPGSGHAAPLADGISLSQLDEILQEKAAITSDIASYYEKIKLLEGVESGGGSNFGGVDDGGGGGGGEGESDGGMGGSEAIYGSGSDGGEGGGSGREDGGVGVGSETIYGGGGIDGHGVGNGKIIGHHPWEPPLRGGDAPVMNNFNQAVDVHLEDTLGEIDIEKYGGGKCSDYNEDKDDDDASPPPCLTVDNNTAIQRESDYYSSTNTENVGGPTKLALDNQPAMEESSQNLPVQDGPEIIVVNIEDEEQRTANAMAKIYQFYVDYLTKKWEEEKIKEEEETAKLLGKKRRRRHPPDEIGEKRRKMYEEEPPPVWASKAEKRRYRQVINAKANRDKRKNGDKMKDEAIARFGIETQAFKLTMRYMAKVISKHDGQITMLEEMANNLPTDFDDVVDIENSGEHDILVDGTPMRILLSSQPMDLPTDIILPSANTIAATGIHVYNEDF